MSASTSERTVELTESEEITGEDDVQSPLNPNITANFIDASAGWTVCSLFF
ncbi:MAG: hypothetical protein ABJL54_05505 [Halioglobus sp.]